MAKEGLIRSPPELRAMLRRAGLESSDLPQVVRDALDGKSDYVVEYRHSEAEEPALDGYTKDLGVDEAIVRAAETMKLDRLYGFQADAASRILRGEDVVIVAPTGSGKTEAFAIPVVEAVRRPTVKLGPFRPAETGIRALFIYPTKALARDQLPRLRRFAEPVGAAVKVFDGDTSPRERREFLTSPPQIAVTNFDILHHHMMHRTPFSKLLNEVRHVVVDDVHVYTGTFGANVSFILKRLTRLCNDQQPQGFL